MNRNLPNKWKKHLTLVEFGLRTKENLESEIHRYSVSNVNKLIEDIRNEFVRHPNSGMYIISSIPISNYYKLPNFCISSLKDLEDFKNSLNNNFFYNFSEVWFCKKPFSNRIG